MKLAILNLFRHGTRSALSIVTISAAVASIVLFHGQSHFILGELFRFGVESQFGHLQIGDQRNWTRDTQKQIDRLHELSPALRLKIESLPELERMFPRLSLQGLISSSASQFSASMVGYDPAAEPTIKDGLSVLEGRYLEPKDEFGILIGVGLRNRLRLKVGDPVSVVTQTVDGVVNAMDLSVTGIVSAGVTEIDDQTAYIPIEMAHRLLDTAKVESWVLRLKNIRDLPRVRTYLNEEINQLQPDLIVKSWRELADLYNRVEEFYGIQNTIIDIILITLTVLAVLNTVGMTIYERTGEIGTLRSLGQTRWNIAWQFILEGFSLGLFGGVTGCILGWILIQALNAAKIAIAMPGASDLVVLEAAAVPQVFLFAMALGVVATVLGTLIPAVRASRMSVVDALRSNI